MLRKKNPCYVSNMDDLGLLLQLDDRAVMWRVCKYAACIFIYQRFLYKMSQPAILHYC